MALIIQEFLTRLDLWRKGYLLDLHHNLPWMNKFFTAAIIDKMKTGQQRWYKKEKVEANRLTVLIWYKQYNVHFHISKTEPWKHFFHHHNYYFYLVVNMDLNIQIEFKIISNNNSFPIRLTTEGKWQNDVVLIFLSIWQFPIRFYLL